MSTDKTYHFSVNDAVRWKSSDIAIILCNLRFWLRHNFANERNAPEEKQPHIHDGRVWTYNSIKAWNELFPWLSGPQIKRLLKKIEDGGLLVKGSYNQDRYDRTTWYSLNESEFYVNQAVAFENKEWTKSSTRQDGIVQGLDEIVHSSPDNKQQIKNSSSKPAEAVFDFDATLSWILEQLQNSGWDDLDDMDKAFTSAKLEEYQERYPSPNKGDALSYVDMAMRQRRGIELRSAKASMARDRVNQSAVNQLETQAAVIDQHTKNMKPKSTLEKLTDTSWADEMNWDA